MSQLVCPSHFSFKRIIILSIAIHQQTALVPSSRLRMELEENSDEEEHHLKEETSSLPQQEESVIKLTTIKLEPPTTTDTISSSFRLLTTTEDQRSTTDYRLATAAHEDQHKEQNNNHRSSLENEQEESNEYHLLQEEIDLREALNKAYAMIAREEEPAPTIFSFSSELEVLKAHNKKLKEERTALENMLEKAMKLIHEDHRSPGKFMSNPSITRPSIPPEDSEEQWNAFPDS